jgi:hypothetical protein
MPNDGPNYVRDDRRFGGLDPPAAVFFYSRDHAGEHSEQHLAGYAGLMQADAYAGFNRLYEVGRKVGPIVEAACWAHAAQVLRPRQAQQGAVQQRRRTRALRRCHGAKNWTFAGSEVIPILIKSDRRLPNRGRQ